MRDDYSVLNVCLRDYSLAEMFFLSARRLKGKKLRVSYLFGKTLLHQMVIDMCELWLCYQIREPESSCGAMRCI